MREHQGTLGPYASDIVISRQGVGSFKVVSCFGSVIRDILLEHGIDLDSEREWFPFQDYLDAIWEVRDRFGDATMFSIGCNVSSEALWPAGIDSLGAALASIDAAYHLNHRGDADIGFYAARQLSPDHHELTCHTPYPPYLDLGIIRGICKTFAPENEPWAISQPSPDDSGDCPHRFVVGVSTSNGAKPRHAWMNSESALLQAVLEEAYSVMNDVAETLTQRTIEMQGSRDQYKRLINNLGERFAVFSESLETRELLYISSGCEQIFDLPSSSALAHRLEDVIRWSDDSRRLMRENHRKTTSGEASHQCHEYSFHHSSGHLRHVEITSRIARDLDGSLVNEGIIQNITYRKELELELQQAATHDPLTSLLNRGEFERRYSNEYQRSQRYKRPLSVIMLDLDHFKLMNDAHGHQAGDAVLRAVADIVLSETRQSDVCGRYGGEEIVMALPDAPPADAERFAERVRQRIQGQRIPYGQQMLQLTASLGVATSDPTCPSAAALISWADQALYASKAAGRNCTTVHRPARHDAASERPERSGEDRLSHLA
ncbi:sensor domain-containing diguanylate cyclase [Synechococcus sp. RSCCF101]|uniref:GGDEF domain-containing protein n=1 Tax=Synechococcus sp. RSCCF101 TaxID=2511069 RepID=UPI0012485DC0|nr:sensor domain-containing diguanylate cyclase [Synechococcus sp. RSCCF101]QEY33035.1 sensor domain-containing diguanylate cyclase [Synechococcus sp. RSCCF101]